MPKRRICSKCGYINNPESENCDNCGADISLIKQTSIPKGISQKFYDNIENVFLDNSPFDVVVESKEDERSFETLELNRDKTINVDEKIINEELTDEFISDTEKDSYNTSEKEEIKVCPLCGYENRSDSLSCVQCGKGLINVKTSLSSLVDFDNLDINVKNEKNDRYTLIFGLNSNNIVPVVFQNNIFRIGRNHQECLANEFSVSRTHCYLRKEGEKIYLFENPKAPSTNHTYIRVSGDRKMKIEPGEFYPIKNGSVVLLAKNITFVLNN